MKRIKKARSSFIRGCVGKIKFWSHEDVHSWCGKRIKNKKPLNLDSHVYHCTFCLGFHLTTKKSDKSVSLADIISKD